MGRISLLSIVFVLLLSGFVWVSGKAFNALLDKADNLTRQHVEMMQDAHALLERSILIEHQTHWLIEGDRERMQETYRRIIGMLDLVDSLVTRMGHTTSGSSVLDLHYASQQFRNTIHVIAGSRSNAATEGGGQRIADDGEKNKQFREQLNQQSETLVFTAGEVFSRVMFDYRESTDRLFAEIESRQLFVTIVAVCCFIILWGAGFYRHYKSSK